MKALKFIGKILVFLLIVLFIGLAIHSYVEGSHNAGAYAVFAVMTGCLFLLTFKS